MTLFTETFFSLVVYGALLWTALGAIVLSLLLVRDRKNKNIW